jgi:hypothetical protein
MRWILIATLLGALLLAHAPVAEAKLCVRIDAPRTAGAGERVTVRVTTLLPTSWDGTRPVGLRPARAHPGRLRLSVTGPGGVYREVRLRLTDDPAVVSTRLRLDQAGRWTLRVAGWEYAPRACAPAARIRVSRRR